MQIYVNACTYVLGLRNERYIMCMYVHSLHMRAKLTKTKRESDRETERQTTINHRGLYHTLFSFKCGSLEEAISQLPKFCLSKIKYIAFNFDIVLKSVVGMQKSLTK